jgi:hypothetical protein
LSLCAFAVNVTAPNIRPTAAKEIFKVESNFIFSF